MLDLGQRRYAFYAHLQPGSARVRVGQRVREGQVLGLLGMSGNTTGPHLHFQVGDTPLLNGSEAVPHEYGSYRLAGRDKPQASPYKPVERALPLDGSIMIFPDAATGSRKK